MQDLQIISHFRDVSNTLVSFENLPPLPITTFFQVPAFESDDGLCLFESSAIAYYVANEQLRGGKDPLAQSQILQWLNFADSDILPAACTWVFPCLGIMQFNKNATERAKEDVKKAMTALNDQLLHQTYLVGERVTLADIVVACTMISLYQNVLDPEFR